MADWVHCNACYVRPGGGKIFVLTNCGHIFCDGCTKGCPDKCKVCGNRYNSIVLSSQMKPEVEQYFTDPGKLCKKLQNDFLQVLEFQKCHRERLKSYTNKREAAFQDFQRQNMSKLKEMEREIAMLREENSQMRRLLGSGSKPGTPHNNMGGSKPGTPHNNRLSPGAGLKRGHSPLTPGSQYSNSPYSRSTTSTPHKDKTQQWQQSQLPRTPAGPARLSVRTPPCNGMMGTPRRTPSPNKQLLQRPSSAGGTPGTLLTRKGSITPGNYEGVSPGLKSATTPGSPMVQESPYQLSSRSSTPGMYSRLTSSQPLPTNYTPGNQTPTYPMSSQPANASSPHCTPQPPYHHSQHQRVRSKDDDSATPSQLDPNRRQIQLRYQPRSLLMGKQPYVTTPCNTMPS